MVLIMLSRLLAMQGPLFLGKFCTSPSSLAYRCELCQSKVAIFFQSRNISKYLVLVDVLLVFAGQPFQYLLLCIRICVYFTWGYGIPGSNQQNRNKPQDIFLVKISSLKNEWRASSVQTAGWRSQASVDMILCLAFSLIKTTLWLASLNFSLWQLPL